MDNIQKNLLKQVADLHSVPEGAYNIRANGELGGRNTTANIDIVTKQDKPGIDIIIKPNTKNESVHIPVIISKTGVCAVTNCATPKAIASIATPIRIAFFLPILEDRMPTGTNEMIAEPVPIIKVILKSLPKRLEAYTLYLLLTAL